MKDNQILHGKFGSLEAVYASVVAFNTACLELDRNVNSILLDRKTKKIHVIGTDICVHGFDDSKVCQDCYKENGE